MTNPGAAARADRETQILRIATRLLQRHGEHDAAKTCQQVITEIQKAKERL